MNATLTEQPELTPGHVIAGKFRLEAVIGRGGMGSVWAARQIQLDMPVALKFIDTEEGIDIAEAHARFEREARATGQIRSPHVVQIIDHGIDAGRPYIVMELLEGEDLGERLRRERRIPVAAASRIITQAAKALRRAHDAGIIHRDLKPGNIYLARFDDDEVVKILDFGVAKMRAPGTIDEPLVTRVGIVFGSPSYMSPEQARGGQTVDHRTDLWSLAVILFRAITGVKPFQGDSLADLVVKVCFDPVPLATHVTPDLPRGVDAFFDRAFARDPAGRFASAPELAAAFEAAIAGAPALAFDPTRAGLLDVATDPHAAPASRSGPQLGFAPGTLTPPPLRPGVEPTPGSGVSSLPSGGWGLAPSSTPSGGVPFPVLSPALPPPRALPPPPPSAPHALQALPPPRPPPMSLPLPPPRPPPALHAELAASGALPVGDSAISSPAMLTSPPHAAPPATPTAGGPSRGAVIFAACAALATLAIAFAALLSSTGGSSVATETTSSTTPPVSSAVSSPAAPPPSTDTASVERLAPVVSVTSVASAAPASVTAEPSASVSALPPATPPPRPRPLTAPTATPPKRKSLLGGR